MTGRPPCNVTYGGFSYRVEPLAVSGDTTSFITARLLAPTGRLWQPPHEQELTPVFSGAAGASDAWSTGFQTKESFFLQRALVNRMIDDGSAVELDELPMAKSPGLPVDTAAAPRA